MSLIADGLPASFFSRRYAVIAGVLVGIGVIIVGGFYKKAADWLTEPGAAPQCYGGAITPGRQPIPGTFLNRSGQPIDDRPPETGLTRMTPAMAACTPQSCPREAWNAYRSAIFWYVASRTQHTSRLYRDYGDAGLALARRVYRQPQDIAIVEGLGARYRASVFRLNDIRQNRAAVSILALAGNDALRPCTGGEVSHED